MQQFLDEIEACVPALRRYARALTRNADRADDLVQDCLERAIRKRRLWAPTGPLRAWLFTQAGERVVAPAHLSVLLGSLAASARVVNHSGCSVTHG